MTRFAKALPIGPATSGSPVERFDGDATSAKVISIGVLRVHCQTCSMRELCLPVGLALDEMHQLDALITHRIKVKKYETLYRAGETFHALYAIRTGSLKTIVLAEDGRDQVAGFHMLGEIIGFDGIATNFHGVEAIALEDAELCRLPFIGIEDLARTVPGLQHNLHQFMSKEMMRDHGAMLMLGSMHADERLIMFLLGLADRYRRRGYSSTEYALRMTRQEIGSYLGLKLETVSRVFSRLHEEGLIQVQGRLVKLLDPVAMKKIIGQHG